MGCLFFTVKIEFLALLGLLGRLLELPGPPRGVLRAPPEPQDGAKRGSGSSPNIIFRLLFALLNDLHDFCRSGGSPEASPRRFLV